MHPELIPGFMLGIFFACEVVLTTPFRQQVLYDIADWTLSLCELVSNFLGKNMSNIAERYIYLCRCYIELADKFQKLDVEHMTLKSKMIPILKTIKACKQTIEQLTQEKLELEQKLQSVTAQYKELKSFEVLLQPETQAVLAEAEEQMNLVQETLLEIDQDSDPGMSEADKLLLEEYYSNSNELNWTNSNPTEKLVSSWLCGECFAPQLVDSLIDSHS